MSVLSSVVARLKNHGVVVPENCDETTATRLLNEALAPRPPIHRLGAHVSECTDSLKLALEHQADVKPEFIARLEDALVEAVRDATLHTGRFFFAGVRSARPAGWDLITAVEAIADALDREAQRDAWREQERRARMFGEGR